MKLFKVWAALALAAALAAWAAGPARAGDLEVEVDTGTGVTLGPEGATVDTSGTVPMEFIQKGLESQPEQEPRPLSELLPQSPAYEDAPPQSQEDMALEIERERARQRALEEEIERLKGERER